jgi:hypothetical protein
MIAPQVHSVSFSGLGRKFLKTAISAINCDGLAKNMASISLFGWRAGKLFVRFGGSDQS